MPLFLRWSAYRAAELDLDCRFRVAGGRVWYEQCIIVGATIRLARLEQLPGMRLRQVNRYIDPETLLEIRLNDSSIQRIRDFRRK